MNKLLSSPSTMLVAAVLLAALGFLAQHFGVMHVPPELALAGFAGIMSPGQARVVDPILTTVAQGYQNAEMIASKLFPVVPVDARGGKILQFGKEDFRLYNTLRSPGANTKRVQYGYLGEPYALEPHSLEGVVPFENMQEANAVPHIDMGRGAVIKTENTIQLVGEVAAANIARNPANYGVNNKIALSGTDKWSDYVNSNPSKDVSDAIEAVRAKTGKRPNTVVLGPLAFAAAKDHPKLLERTKYTSKDSLTADMLAALWNVKRVVVGDAIYLGDDGEFYDVWGNDVIVAYTELGTLVDNGLPSYGYTYRLRGYPLVEVPYQERNTKSWIYPVTDERSPVLASAEAGFLIQGAG